MKIQSVAILGAGAVGCYVLWGLADKAAANSLQLGVVAEGSRAERLRQNGCTINGHVYHPQVWTPQQAHGVDLLIVALKYGALPGALDSIRTIVSERPVRPDNAGNALADLDLCLIGEGFEALDFQFFQAH